MKTKVYAVLATILLLAPLAAAAQGAWEVDSSHSGVNFSVRHLFSQVRGRFQDFSGEIHYDPANVDKASVSFTVQATSIDTDNDDRDNHLRSADFFEVEKYPTLSFKSSSVKKTGDGQLDVTGEFTLHGVTKTLTVPIEILGTMETPRGAVGGFHAEFTINRQDYGVKWNRVLDNGGTILSDDIMISIDVEARQPLPEKTEEAS